MYSKILAANDGSPGGLEALDADGDTCLEWLQQVAQPNLNAWATAGLAVKILVPADVARALKLPPRQARWGILICHPLQWQNDQIRQMIEWRRQQSGASRQLTELIDGDVLDEMIVKSQLNPGCFARFWTAAATHSMTQGKITQAVWQQVEKQVSCR